jgi:hypothetical protein
MWLAAFTLVLAFAVGMTVWSLWGVPGVFVAVVAVLLVGWRLTRKA